LGDVAYTNSLNAGRDGSLKARDRAAEGSDDVSFCGGHRCGKDVGAKGEESEKAGGELHFECDVCYKGIFKNRVQRRFGWCGSDRNEKSRSFQRT